MPKVPTLGICLGHQSIGQAYGGTVRRARRVMHGKISPIHHGGRGVFRDLPPVFEATRYHSLIVTDVPDCLEVTAWTAHDHGGPTKSWACATATIRCRACSSIPNRSKRR